MAAVLRARRVVNRGSAERAVAQSDLPMAETLTMMMLLRRAHNDTLTVPDWRTPSLPQLAAEVRITERWQRELLTHLERHGWVKVAPGRGRGHKSTYALLPGNAVPGPCDCRKRGTGKPPLQAEKGNSDVPEKGNSTATEPQATPGIAPRAHQGGRVNKGTLPPDWALIRQIIRIVHNDPCGGLHRDALAERCGVAPRTKYLDRALAIAYRRKKIGFCGQYVVKPVKIP
jgi:hypothetical protein